ncbi:MAG TPA: hypothetical protein VFM39_01515, partial [bacterium]|nr:hypothetical protein [bacterium]
MSSRRLRAYILRHRRAYLFGFALSLVSTTLYLINPWVLRLAIDGIRTGAPPRVFVALAVVYVAVRLTNGFVGYHWRMFTLGAGHTIEYEIRNDYFA